MADVAERLCTMANSIWLLPTLKCHGLWERINKELVKQVLVKAGREPEPSTAIIDSQSVKNVRIQDGIGYLLAERLP
jgi:transposase